MQARNCVLAFSSLYLDQLLIPFFPEVHLFFTCITLTKPVFLQQANQYQRLMHSTRESQIISVVCMKLLLVTLM